MTKEDAISLVELMKQWYNSTEDKPDLEEVSRVQYLELKLQYPEVYSYWTNWLHWEYKKGVNNNDS